MNKEKIGTMLSAASPAPINGEGRGSRPDFTVQDAMYSCSGMPQAAWDYFQYVDILEESTKKAVLKNCSQKLIAGGFIKNREKAVLVAKVALEECRTKPFTNVDRCSRIKVSERSWYRRYAVIYGIAQRIYNELDNQAGRYIAIKLGKIN